jgi:hypothetical protein
MFGDNDEIREAIKFFLIKNYPSKAVMQNYPGTPTDAKEPGLLVSVDNSNIENILKELNKSTPLIPYEWETVLDESLSEDPGIRDTTVSHDTVLKIIFGNFDNPEGLIKESKPLLELQAVHDDFVQKIIHGKQATGTVNNLTFTITPHGFRTVRFGFIDLDIKGNNFKGSFKYTILESERSLYRILAPPHAGVVELFAPYCSPGETKKAIREWGIVTAKGGRFESDSVLILPNKRRKQSRELGEALLLAMAQDIPLSAVVSLRS